ncbi:Ig-like domain-containing protein [Streptomyces antnestii]|uniref:Ig-like domain-containing protein n=1 Tax=Streptomyces antnestii TaxID=2494256 RepID=UPI001CB97F82|nr:Ig-like domain-containing protein [Streptomyces sp. San01]
MSEQSIAASPLQPERHLLARVHAVQADAPQIRLTVELTASADPALPVRPGQEVDFAVTLLPEGSGHRYYGYVMAAPFERVATVDRLGGMSLLPSKDRYASSVEAGTSRVARFTAVVRHDVGGGAFLLPEVRAGIIAHGGSSLTSSTHSVRQYGYRIAPFPPQGRVLHLAPGYRGVVKDLLDGLGDAARLAGVGPARQGVTSVEPDGVVTYTPFTGHLGYDRFSYAVDDGTGHVMSGQVTVCIGELQAPGVLGG